MGSGDSKINYETVDRTDPNAARQGRQQAEEENQERIRRLQIEMQRDHEQAIREAQERARCEDEEQRNRLECQRLEREERERQRKEEESFCQLKDALMNYDLQESPRIKKESFRDLNIEDMDGVRIALIGPTGSGKTSFIGTLQRSLSGDSHMQTAFEQGEGKEGTIILEDYKLHPQMSLLDTRGFFDSDEKLLEECLNIMSGRIRPGEEIERGYDGSKDKGKGGNPQTGREAPHLSKYAHAVIFVVKANDPRLKDGKYKNALQKMREHFREDGYAPVTVITYLDKLRDDEDKSNAFDMASWAIGSSSERTFFISNYTHTSSDTSLTVERTALDILDFALLSAERFIRIKKQREKNQREREIAAGGASRGAETVEQFFARLRKKYNWTDQGKMKEVVSELRKNEINTVKVLKELWEDVKGEIPLSIGMKKCLEVEIQKV